MKKISRLAPWFLAVVLAWSAGYLYNVWHGGELSFLLKLYRNKVQWLDDIQSPQRIIFVGGSGVQYSLDASQIEKEFSIPAFNFGLQGDLGLNVIFPTVLERLRPNDIVVVIPEYLMLFDEDGLGKGETLFGSGTFGLAIGKPGLGGIGPKRLLEDAWSLGVPGLKVLTKSAVSLVEKGKFAAYYVDPFTNRGDYTVVKSRNSKWHTIGFSSTISEHSQKRLQQFRQEVEAKGAHLLISLPWIYVDTRERDKVTWENVENAAKQLEKIAPTVYDTSNFNLHTDSSMFADTHYHLLPFARKIRTQKLANELRPYIEKLRVNKTVSVAPEN
jgi:hypothetical protein